MTHDEHKKLLQIYEIIISGRIDYARTLLEELLEIKQETPSPDAA